MKNQVAPIIYVINLKKDIIKKQHISKQLDKLGLTAEFIEAIDGNSLKESDMKALSNSIPKLGNGEIGCFLSHRKIYQRIIERGHSWSIVLEDDVDLKGEFIEVINSLSKLPQDSKLILLGHHSCNGRNLKTIYTFRNMIKIFKNYKVARPLEKVCGTYGYLISLEGAKALLSKTTSIQKPIDHYTGECNDPSILVMVPEVVTINPNLDRMSSINIDRIKRRKSSIIIKERLLKIGFINSIYQIRHYILSIFKGMLLVSCSKRDIR